MKLALPKPIVATAAVAILLISHPLYAQNEPSGTGRIHYSVINLGTLGGTESNGFGGVNNRGWVTGDANLAGDQNEHAVLWRDGVITDLGTLGGPNSSVPMVVKDDRGFVVGVAQIAMVDPLNELWGTTFVCTPSMSCQGWQNLLRGFLWENGVMTALPTLGGNNSGALGVNNRGQIVGAAETANQDPNCVPPQVLDFKAVVWGPRRGQIEVLPVFPGDTVATALAINDNGQAVGTSGLCQGPTSGSGLALRHAVLWQRDTVTNLGSLGGVMSNAANGINNRGQVVGQSNLPGDAVTHAFLWQKGVMTDLGTLPGDSNSIAFDINEKGQIVGISCDMNFNCRPFLWDDEVMTDLNTLIPPNSPLYLTFGGGINDRGEIAGSACVLSNGVCTNEVPAFLAVPCDDEHASYEGCADGATGVPLATQAIRQRTSVILPESIRQHLHRRLGLGRLTVGPVKQQ
jgi:probable HAF family extracellular repeat protein